MRTIIIFALCLCTAFSSKCESSALVKNIANDIISQLEELMLHNAENTKHGNGKDNKYILNYIPGKSFAIENCEPSYIIDKIPNANLNESWSSLSDQLCEYNNNNVFNIKHYGIAIWYPDNTMDTELYELMAAFTSIDDNTNIVTFTKSQQDEAHRRAFKEIYAEIEAHVKQNVDIPGIENNGELLVTMMSIFSIRDHKQNHSYDARTRTFYAASGWMDEKFSEYINYSNTAVLEVDGLDLDFYYGDFYRRLYSFIQYFSGDSDLPQGTSCSTFPISDIELIATFISNKCSPDLTPDEVSLLYALQLFLENYEVFGGVGAEYDNEIMAWANEIFETYDEQNNQEAWKVFLKNRILIESDPNNPNHYLDAQLYLTTTTFIDHNKLSASDRFNIIKKILQYPHITVVASEAFKLNQIDVVNEFLYTAVENNYFDAFSFLSLIKNDTGVFSFLWTDILNTTFGTADKKMNIIKSINKLSMLTFNSPNSEAGFSIMFQDKAYIWKLNPWWTNMDDHHTYFDAGFDGTTSVDYPYGKSYFNHRYLTGYVTSYTGNSSNPIALSNPVFNSDQLKIYDPFELICVKAGTNFKWNTHCPSLLSDGDCTFSPKIIPAFALSWYVSNVQSELTIDQYTDIIAGVSVAISFAAFIGATSVSGTLVTGLVLVLDAVSVAAPPLEAYTSYALFPGDYNANAINSSVQLTQGISNQIGLAAGVFDVGYMLKGLVSYRRLKNLGAMNPVNAYDKAFEGMRAMSQVDPSDLVKIADNYNFGPTARNYIGSTNATHEIKLDLIGMIETYPFLKSVSDEKVFTLLRRSLEIDDITKHLYTLSPTQLAKFLEEFADSSGDVSKIVANPALISAWRIADDVVPNRPRCFAF